MAFDEQLADRVREALAARSDLSEQRMFGGLGFTIDGNMACGVMEDELILRLPPEEAEAALREPDTRPFDFTGRPMKGWIFVGSEAIAGQEALAGWVDAGADYAASMPSK